MTRIILFLFLAFTATCTWAIGATSEMVRVGSGEIRYLGLIKVYDASLYLNAEQARTQQVLDSDVSRCLKLDYDVSLKVEHFVEGAETIMAKQHNQATIEAVRPEIDMLHQAYRDVEPGDSYFLCYDSKSGVTSLALNAQQLVAVESPQFAELYFGIWLGEKNPIDTKLRDQLLSRQL
ncbi:chalcone isomerase family protein [Desulfopila aestuarii]|uniref:Chalcone isomerase-like n=1 Tax=Desulfopila aestuarii DSM 18488 TaxID=1121416 RepID=A0A1M7XXV6_9BACT|nr:chalcone isomerase family protein [Desulfopila aestuarii]SHO43689.1 Chalcone isomerase-like [Desulfopila aestuarii DSM 18488]